MNSLTSKNQYHPAITSAHIDPETNGDALLANQVTSAN